VRGNTVRARHLGRDVLAGLRNVVGGEITEYTEMLSKAREEAVQRMISQAEELGADAVVGVPDDGRGRRDLGLRHRGEVAAARPRVIRLYAPALGFVA